MESHLAHIWLFVVCISCVHSISDPLFRSSRQFVFVYRHWRDIWCILCVMTETGSLLSKETVSKMTIGDVELSVTSSTLSSNNVIKKVPQDREACISETATCNHQQSCSANQHTEAKTQLCITHHLNGTQVSHLGRCFYYLCPENTKKYKEYRLLCSNDYHQFCCYIVVALVATTLGMRHCGYCGKVPSLPYSCIMRWELFRVTRCSCRRQNCGSIRRLCKPTWQILS